MKEFDARDIRSFTVLATELSFTRAAARLRVTQPQLSLRIKQLEDNLGFRLFERSSRRVTLTRQGEALLAQANRVIAEMERFTGAVGELRFERKSLLRVGGPEYFQPLRRSLLRAYLAANPKMDIRVEPVVRDQDAKDALLANRLDLAFLLTRARNHFDDFESIVLAREPVGILLPADHPLARRKKITPDDLAGGSLSLFERELWPELYDDLASFIARCGAKAVPLLEATTDGIAYFARDSGIGVLCSKWWSTKADRPRGLIHRKVEGLTFEMDCVLVRRRGKATEASNSLWRFAFRHRLRTKDTAVKTRTRAAGRS
jgi:DNA-binding transcriptional LysR family regulator